MKEKVSAPAAAKMGLGGVFTLLALGIGGYQVATHVGPELGARRTEDWSVGWKDPAPPATSDSEETRVAKAKERILRLARKQDELWSMVDRLAELQHAVARLEREGAFSRDATGTFGSKRNIDELETALKVWNDYKSYRVHFEPRPIYSARDRFLALLKQEKRSEAEESEFEGLIEWSKKPIWEIAPDSPFAVFVHLKWVYEVVDGRDYRG